MANKIYQGAVGVVFTIDTGETLSGATLTNLKVQNPDLTTSVWVGTVSPSTPTAIQYISGANDLSQVGNYLICAYVEYGSTSKHSGTVIKLKVNAPFT